MSKPRPTLSDMPWHVKQDVVNGTDYETRLFLRGCSKEYRNIIGNSRVVEYPPVIIDVTRQSITRTICSKHSDIPLSEVLYSDVSGYSCSVSYIRRGDEWKKPVTGQHHIQKAATDIAALFKDPRSTVECLEIATHDPHPRVWQDVEILLTCLREELKKLPHQLNVLRFDCNFSATQGEVLHVLPYLKPGTLQRINIMNDIDTRGVDQLVNTEQWRMAQHVVLENESNVRLQDLLHLESFEIKHYRLVPDEMPLLIQAFLSRYERSPFYRIGLPDNYDLEPIMEWLNENETLEAGIKANVWYSKIPGTEFHLNISLEKGEFQMFLL